MKGRFSVWNEAPVDGFIREYRIHAIDKIYTRQKSINIYLSDFDNNVIMHTADITASCEIYEKRKKRPSFRAVSAVLLIDT